MEHSPTVEDRPHLSEAAIVAAPLWAYGAALAVLILAGLLFGAIAQTARQEDPNGIDHRIPGWVARHGQDWPGPTLFFRCATRIGNPEVAYPLSFIIAYVLASAHRRGLGGVRGGDWVFFLGVTAGGQLLNIALKLWFQRDRPPAGLGGFVEDSFSFPSGHSVFAAVFFGTLAVLIARRRPGRHLWFRLSTIAACLVMIPIVASSRVWLGFHYPTDVLGGLFLGASWVAVAWLIRFEWARFRHRRRMRGRGMADDR